MDESQLATWMEYYSLEPFGPKRDDLRAGLIASWIVNTNIDPSKTEPRAPDSFFVYGDDKKEKDKKVTPKQWKKSKAELKAALAQVSKGKAIKLY